MKPNVFFKKIRITLTVHTIAFCVFFRKIILLFVGFDGKKYFSSMPIWAFVIIGDVSGLSRFSSREMLVPHYGTLRVYRISDH